MFNQRGSAASDPAPLDRAGLELALAPFGSSRMLPKAAYLDPEVLAWERRHLLAGWQCLGRVSEVADAGRLAARSVGESSILLARDKHGELRAFENACRHRGHELLPCGADATTRAIVCPYHAWAYRYDGTMRGAPGFRDTEGFDPTQFSLVSVPVREWHGWVFVDPSGAAGDLDEHVGDLDRVLAPYDAGALLTAQTHEYDVAANWKTVIENYQECYHCSMIHPELCRISPPDSGDNLDPTGQWVGGSMDLRAGMETMSLDGRSGGSVLARLDKEEQHTVMYIAVMPNLLISLHPDYVMSHLLTPIAPGLTRIRCSWAFPPAAIERDGFDPAYAVDFWDLTNRQDWSACESVQRGMHARGYRPGPLAPAEDGVYQFVTLVARRYLGQSAVRV